MGTPPRGNTLALTCRGISMPISVQKNPGKMTNNLAGAGENAYSRDAPTSLRHVYRTTGTILVSYICSKLRLNTKELFNVHYGLGRQTPRVHRTER